jgi:hypothetical protein
MSLTKVDFFQLFFSFLMYQAVISPLPRKNFICVFMPERIKLPKKLHQTILMAVIAEAFLFFD